MATKIRAHSLPTTMLLEHEVHRQTQVVLSQSNYLSLHPRMMPEGGKSFENDGPGNLSAAGARHDNDFVDIRDIRILPTADEILSRRAPYMPFKRFVLPHFLHRAPERLVDTLFRQLRHVNAEKLNDCVYSAA